jgi:hypothetical protein
MVVLAYITQDRRIYLGGNAYVFHINNSGWRTVISGVWAAILVGGPRIFSIFRV